MIIPKEVKQFVAAARREQKLLKENNIKPKCLAKLGLIGASFHNHDRDGNCITKNWSRDEVFKSVTGGTWTRRVK